VGEGDLSMKLNKAIDTVLNKDQVRTRDLGGKASTADFARAIIKRLK